jgi:hypothetical protein
MAAWDDDALDAMLREEVGHHRTNNFDDQDVLEMAKRTGVSDRVMRVALEVIRWNVPIRACCAAHNLGHTTFEKELLTGNYSMDETVRWRESQRDERLYTVTAIVDVAFVPSKWKDPLLWSSKHNQHGWKFQVTVSAQGTPLHVEGPFPGRWHDFKCFDNVLVPHCVNDVVLADLAYQGANGHTFLPHKRQPRRDLSQGQTRENATFRNVHARVEHFLSLLKNWKLVSEGPAVRNPFLIRALVSIAVLFEHRRMLCAGPRYPTAAVPLARGPPCDCSWKKRGRDNDPLEGTEDDNG